MTQSESWISPERRRDHLLEYLSSCDKASVGQLSQVLSVSEVTIRKDLDLLEEQGLLLRIHGGAMVSGRGRLERHFAAREQEHRDKKRRIAHAAARLVQPGQCIFLDASTTALQIARLLKDRGELTVVTNGLYTALELNFSAGVTTLVTGGTMRHRSSSLVGSLSSDLLQRLHVEIGFFGASAVSATSGLMEADLDEAQLKQRMVHASALVVGVVDASKLGRQAFHAFALPTEIDRIITDSQAPFAIVEQFHEQAIAVELV